MDLKDFTTEQLRDELKRRAKEARISAVKNRKRNGYIYVKGIVTKVLNEDMAFSYHRYRVKILDSEMEKLSINPYDVENDYQLKSGHFTKATAPKVGEYVYLSHLLTLSNKHSFRRFSARIVPLQQKPESHD